VGVGFLQPGLNDLKSARQTHVTEDYLETL